jgi:uncharacterized zinc-type alcohol dehydrogenase-like protein
VGIVGIGGLGHMAIQFARAFGAEVTAFSTSAAKEEEARALGAHNFVNSRESKAMKDVAGTMDFDFEHRQRRPGLGSLRAGAAAYRNAVLCGGSAVAGQRAGVSAHQRAALHQRQPVGKPLSAQGDAGRGGAARGQGHTESFPMAQANTAIEKVKKGKVRYRAVLAN